MSELLHKQVYVLNECFKYKFRDSCASHASPRKGCDENERKKQRKKEKNDGYVKFFDDMKDFVWLLLKLDITNVDELQDNNSLHTKGTICLVNG